MLIAAIGVFLAIDMVYLVIVTAVPHTRIVGSQIEPVGTMHVQCLHEEEAVEYFINCIECLTLNLRCRLCVNKALKLLVALCSSTGT